MRSNRGSQGVLRAGVLCLLAVVHWSSEAGGSDLGSGLLQIAGARLSVSPESQTVPYSTPTVVDTSLEGFDPLLGSLPEGLRVVGDLTGPEIDGILVLETRPNDPFRIPRFSLKGEYQLENIRLVQDGELLAYAQPRSAAILVTQVLVTRVSSRALTMDEIRSYGIVVSDGSHQAFNFTFGFAVGGEVYDYNVPVLYNPVGFGDPLRAVVLRPSLGGTSTGTTSARFKPPQMAPFTLQLSSQGSGAPKSGGCATLDGDCSRPDPVVLPGVLLFPTDISLLHQFFSVVVLAQNGAPEGDPLVIRDLTARVSLPSGLRLAETEPPTPLGVPVPVRVPGPDGELGTGDDLTFLVAQASGEAEVLVEGMSEGTHVVQFDLDGVLDGLPTGIQRITGTARGAVLVRDPRLGITITHPEVVRTDEEYSLLLTVSNTSNAPVSSLTVSLPASGLSGVELLGSPDQTIDSLLPAESEVVEYQLRSLRTGKVVASSVRAGSEAAPVFELSVGVGDADIPLSPTSIILPRSTENLPVEVVRHSLGLLGLGFSLATAPPAFLDPSLPALTLEQIDEHAYWLAQAGRHVELGEDPFDSVASLGAEWCGARDADWEWDLLRRATTRGPMLDAAVGQVLADEAAVTSPESAFARFFETTAFLGVQQGVLVVGDEVHLEVSQQSSGQRLAGLEIGSTVRELPFGALYDLGGAEMALLAVPADGSYRARVDASTAGNVGVQLLVPDIQGQLRRVRWSNVALGAGGSGVVDFRASDTSFTLQVDSDGDGMTDSDPLGTLDPLTARPFSVLSAIQNAEADMSGHIVDVLFSQGVDLASLLPADPQRFQVQGKISNGGLIQAEQDIGSLFELIAANPFAGLYNTRIVRVIFNNPLSPYASHDLVVRDVTSVTGEEVTGATVPIQTTVSQPGELVSGTVFGPDGEPVPYAEVGLYETDVCSLCMDPCKTHRTAAVRADETGRFLFDYVRQTGCSDVYTLEAQDPATNKRGKSRGRVRFAGQTTSLDIVMLGRGTIRGRVLYDDGSLPETPRVIATSPVFYEGREARIDAFGNYEVGDIPVGTVTLAATDREGSYVFQTVEIPAAGAVIQRDLVIIRRSPDEASGNVQGAVFETDGITPVFDAYIALYVDGQLLGVERSDVDGEFDFGTVPAGLAEVEGFDAETGLSGVQVFFDIQPDQVNDITLLLRDDRGTVEGHIYRQSISGTVPVEGAVVWVSGTPFNTLTDETGFYRLDEVFSGTRHVLAADLQANLQTSAAVSVADGAIVTRDLYFVETLNGGLAGEVLGTDGTPVAAATVHLAAGPSQWHHEVMTDANGRFVIPDLGPGGYEVHAFKASQGGVKRTQIRYQGETPFVTVRFKKGSIQGQVQATNESGNPVGVIALVTYRTTVERDGLLGLDYDAHTLETAGDGTFEIPDVLAGRYVLTVSNAFHGEKTIWGEIVDHGEVRKHDVLFEQNGEIRGVVLDHDGATPVPGAHVELHHPGFGLYELTSDVDGRFTFELVPPGGTFPIEVEYDDGMVFRTARIWVQLTRFGQEVDVEVPLPKQGAISGWVEDSNGDAVPGAVVTLQERSYPNRRLVHNADGEGSFVFTNVFAGEVSVSAQAPALGGLGGKTTATLAEEGEEVLTVVTLEDTGEIVGRVMSPATGEPVASAEVRLDRWWHGFFDSTTSDENGEFRFRLLPLGSYDVRVFDPTTGRHGRINAVPVSENNQVSVAEVWLEVRGEVDGSLTEPSATAGIPAATVRLSTHSLASFTTYSSTDKDGYFEFLGIPEGTVDLHTREPEGRRRAWGSGEITEEGQRITVDLVLEESGRVVGTVLTPEGLPDGPFANANTLATQDGYVVGATLENPYSFDGLIADRSFHVEASEVGGSHRGRSSGELGHEGEEVTVDVRMEPRGRAVVSVQDSFGNVVSGADVDLRSHGFYGSHRYSGSTGPSGAVTFEDVGAGDLSATVTDPRTGLKGSGSAAIGAEGETGTVTVALEDSGEVSGRVVLSDAATPAFEALVVLQVGSRTLKTFVAEDGSFSFLSVPVGSFVLYVQEHYGPGFRELRGTVVENGQQVDMGLFALDDRDPFVLSIEPCVRCAGCATRYRCHRGVQRDGGSFQVLEQLGHVPTSGRCLRFVHRDLAR